MDHAGHVEKFVRMVVAVVLFALPTYSVLIFLLALQQVEIPNWVKGEPSFWVATCEAIALVLSVFLCWRLPGNRKYLALVMDILLVLVTIAGLMVQFANLQREAVAKKWEDVRATPEYQRLENRLEAAKDSLRLQTARMAIIPADQMTQANNTSREIRLVKVEIAGIDDQLKNLERTVQNTRPSTHYGLVDLLTAPDSGWLKVLLIVAFGIGNHINGVILIYRPRDRVLRGTRILSEVKVRKLPAPPLSPEAERYLATASDLGSSGKIAGYRAVATALKISPAIARKYMEECQNVGWIQNRRRVEMTKRPNLWECIQKLWKRS